MSNDRLIELLEDILDVIDEAFEDIIEETELILAELYNA